MDFSVESEGYETVVCGKTVDGMVFYRQCSGILVQPHVPWFCTHVQRNVTGLYHFTSWR
jgi:hypothetical protein